MAGTQAERHTLQADLVVGDVLSEQALRVAGAPVVELSIVPPRAIVRETVLGHRVDAIDLPEAVEMILHRAMDGEAGAYVCCTNVHATVESQDRPDLQAAADGAFLSVPDGMPLAWILKKRGLRADRVAGMELTETIAAAGVPKRLRHFFFGGAPGVAEKAAEALQALAPGMIVTGTYSPPFSEDGSADLADLKAMIAETHPHIIWVGLGCPKQELWMANHAQFLGVPMMVGIGAAFDFLAGDKRRAPRWIQRSGLEWLFRLVSEPRRLWRRYLVGNSRFLYLLLRDWLLRPIRTTETEI